MTEPDKLYTGTTATAISMSVLAGLLDIGERRIQQLGGQGILTKTGPGHYVFPDCIKQYCAYLRGGGEAKEATLKQRELELKCKRLEQTIAEYDQARRDDIESDCWEQVQDFLAEYKSELDRLPLDLKQIETLNSALDKAIARTTTIRQSKAIPDTAAKVGPDSVD